MLFLIGFAIMIAGVFTAVVVARKGIERSGDLMTDAMLNTTSALDAFGDGFFEGDQTTSRQSVSRGFSAMLKTMLENQLKTAKKNWKLFLVGALAYLAIIIGVVCMIVWFIHFLWTLFF